MWCVPQSLSSQDTPPLTVRRCLPQCWHSRGNIWFSPNYIVWLWANYRIRPIITLLSNKTPKVIASALFAHMWSWCSCSVWVCGQSLIFPRWFTCRARPWRWLDRTHCFLQSNWLGAVEPRGCFSIPNHSLRRQHLERSQIDKKYFHNTKVVEGRKERGIERK